MKKVLLSAFAVIAFVAATNAQDFGVKVGANFANVSGDDAFDQTDSKFNFTFGVFGEFMLSDKIGLQPELIFSGQGYKFDGDFGGTTVEYKQKFSYVNIPIMANIYLAESFFLQAGPYVGFLTSAEANVSGSLGVLGGDNKDSFSGTDFGAMAGLGVKAGKFDFGLRYQLGLANIADEDAFGDFEAKNRVLQVNLGFRFLDN